MTDQIELLTKRSYEIIEDLSKTIDAETDANTAMQLKKLQADFYRNLSTFVPSEKEKVRIGVMFLEDIGRAHKPRNEGSL